jgi:hypothetical protein
VGSNPARMFVDAIHCNGVFYSLGTYCVYLSEINVKIGPYIFLVVEEELKLFCDLYVGL